MVDTEVGRGHPQILLEFYFRTNFSTKFYFIPQVSHVLAKHVRSLPPKMFQFQVYKRVALMYSRADQNF